MSNRPFTFGVELEMLVALVPEEQQKPDPSETRIVEFPSTDDPEDIGRNKLARKIFPAIYYRNRVQAEFKRIIGEAGFPVASTGTDIFGWAVVGDTSLSNPPPNVEGVDLEGYSWCGIEIKTPALPFTPESLQAVKDVCALVQKHFKILNNTTTGLHVHIGHGQSGFSTHDVLKIMAFCYAFEPQLSSLHPIYRYSHLYGRAMRHTCNFNGEFQMTYGEMPSALMFITKALIKHRRREKYYLKELVSRVHIGRDGKDGNYNFNGMADLGLDNPKPTIEFRQHEGTMDRERIVQWVKLLVGALTFVENEVYESYVNFLITIAEQETWQKSGDRLDVGKEIPLDPILADGAFTVIDLLRYIGLTEQVDYFQDKVLKHDILAQKPFVQTKNTSGYEWEYQKGSFGTVANSKAYQQDHEIRCLFEKFRIARRASRMAGDDWNFDENHSMWPAHKANHEFIEGSDDGENEERIDEEKKKKKKAEVKFEREAIEKEFTDNPWYFDEDQQTYVERQPKRGSVEEMTDDDGSNAS